LLDGEADALVLAEQAALAAEVEHDGAAVDQASHDGGDHAGLAGEPTGLAGRDLLAGAETGGAQTRQQLVVVEGDDDGRVRTA
jgi:hypothetical protein